MDKRCKACNHPQLAAINSALVAGETERSTAKRYGLTSACIHRHAVTHLPKSLARAVERKVAKGEDSLLDEALWIVQTAKDILASTDDPDVKLRALDRITRGADLRGRVTGEIAPPQVQALFVNLGVGGEDELRRLVERNKALSGYSLDDAERDGVEALRLVLAEHPDRAGRIRSSLFGEREVQSTISGNGPSVPVRDNL